MLEKTRGLALIYQCPDDFLISIKAHTPYLSDYPLEILWNYFVQYKCWFTFGGKPKSGNFTEFSPALPSFLYTATHR